MTKKHRFLDNTTLLKNESCLAMNNSDAKLKNVVVVQ